MLNRSSHWPFAYEDGQSKVSKVKESWPHLKKKLYLTNPLSRGFVLTRKNISFKVYTKLS